jgi:hypothetical protein
VESCRQLEVGSDKDEQGRQDEPEQDDKTKGCHEKARRYIRPICSGLICSAVSLASVAEHQSIDDACAQAARSSHCMMSAQQNE